MPTDMENDSKLWKILEGWLCRWLSRANVEPQGYVAAMRKLASAPEPIIRPARRTQPPGETGNEKHERGEIGELERLEGL